MKVLPHAARLSMLAFAPNFVVLLNCLHDIAPDDKKILTRLCVHFGFLFAGLVSIQYFVQVTAVRLSLQNNQLNGLEQLVFFTLNFGLGGALLAVFSAAMKLFKQKQRKMS